MKKIRVGILGVTGYTGQELLKILLRHPNSSVSYVGSRQVESSVPLGTILPSVRYAKDCQVSPLDFEQAARASDLLFLALPHGMAMQMVPALFQYNSKLKVIDLSGDFRLNSADSYEEAYHQPHTAHRFLKEAVYGLSEWERNSIRKSRLIANPGCYPTASLLGLLPLSEAGLLASEGLIIDAKSGITGAGRSAQEELLFSEINEDLRAYKVNAHQHIPEMEQVLGKWGKRTTALTFVPHLVPMDRGIYATIYAPLKRSVTEKHLRSLYHKRYAQEPFIQLLPHEIWPQIKLVSNTNLCVLGMKLDSKGSGAIIISAIDNLGKGAAGQAVQNMNIMYGLNETAGLLP